MTEHVTKRRLSAPPVLEQEARLLDFADAALEAAPDDRPDAVVEAIAGRGRLVLVVGPAGAGKTTAVAEGARRLKEQRRLLVGLAPSGKAADVLAEATGAKCVTLAKLLHNDRTGGSLPPRDTTIVLDEAGMASTDDLDHLVGLVQRHGWRLIAVGDPEQLPAVGRGGMFAHWTDTLPAHRLEHIHRFAEPWQGPASLRLRRGDPTAAAEYVERDRARTVHPDVVAHQAARLHERAVEQGQRLAITTGSGETARRINEEIQTLIHADDERRDENVRLTRPLTQRLTHRLADGTEVRVGDQIATRRNARLTTDRGVPVRNRHVWTVVGIDRNGSLVGAHDERGTVTLPGSYVAEAVELGWAVTGYGNQGDTTDHSLTVIEPGMSRAGICVGFTRGRGTNLALIVDPTGAAEPEEAFARAIARPANAETAHATRDELWVEQGFDPPRRTPAEHRVESPQVEIEPVRRTAPTLGL